MSNDSTTKTILAFIGGAAVGALVGVLLAPDKGSETRKKLISGAKDIGDDLTEAATEKYNEVLAWKDRLINNAENKASKIVNDAEEAASKLANKAENKIRNQHV